MRMSATLVVESDDGRHQQVSVSSIGVDTRLPGIDPDSAKEDFLAQARGLLTSIGETHVPALYAAVQKDLDATGPGPEEPSPAQQAVSDKLRQLREKKAGQPAADDATAELKGQV